MQYMPRITKNNHQGTKGILKTKMIPVSTSPLQVLDSDPHHQIQMRKPGVHMKYVKFLLILLQRRKLQK